MSEAPILIKHNKLAEGDYKISLSADSGNSSVVVIRLYDGNAKKPYFEKKVAYKGNAPGDTKNPFATIRQTFKKNTRMVITMQSTGDGTFYYNCRHRYRVDTDDHVILEFEDREGDDFDDVVLDVQREPIALIAISNEPCGHPTGRKVMLKNLRTDRSVKVKVEVTEKESSRTKTTVKDYTLPPSSSSTPPHYIGCTLGPVPNPLARYSFRIVTALLV